MKLESDRSYVMAAAHDLVDRCIAIAQESALPTNVLESAKQLLVDTVGISIAALSFPVGDQLRRYLDGAAPAGSVPMLGMERTTIAETAALITGALASGLDFDEGYHVATYIVATALAVGAAERRTGAEMLAAIVAGYETAECIRLILDGRREYGDGLTKRGWYHVGFSGPVSSALTAATLMKLSREQMVAAVGIAVCSCGGVRQNFGTGAKVLQPGLAAQAGVSAANFARCGLTADGMALDGRHGLEAALRFDAALDWGQARTASSREYALAHPPDIRQFPACAPAHPAIACALNLKVSHNIVSNDITRIDLMDHGPSLSRPEARDATEAAFSLPYLVSAALADGEVTLAQMRAEKLVDPEVRRLMSLVEVHPKVMGQEPVQLSVTLRDGKQLIGEEAGIDYLHDPMPVHDKFITCCQVGGLQMPQTEELYALLCALEMQPDIAEAIALTRLPRQREAIA